MKIYKTQKQKQVLAALLMSFNTLNSIAPLTLATHAVMQPTWTHIQRELQTVTYELLPQATNFVDGLIFSTAHAHDYDGNDTVPEMVSGDTQNISAGEAGKVDIMYGGAQTVYTGGSGNIGTMSDIGTQTVHTGGTGTINTMSRGQQLISGGIGNIGTMFVAGEQVVSSGSGTVTIMSGGLQTVHTGGTGTISTMYYPEGSLSRQNISGGTGNIITMNGGSQNIFGGTGNIITMNGGTQNISSGGIGNIITMHGAQQSVYKGGTGTITTMSGGSQFIYSGGIGTISTMSGGKQNILGGTGMVSTMSGGQQNINDRGTGTIITMSGGTQSISSGTATISVMNGGSQFIATYGDTGTIDTMHNGEQQLNSGGSGTITTMSGGTQYLFTGNGTIVTIGTIVTMHGGHQVIRGNGTITTMSGGTQTINKGQGTITTMSGGSQVIENQGQGTVSSLLAGGTQVVNSGGTSLNTVINGGSMQLNSGGFVVGLTVNSGNFAVNGGTVDMTNTADIRNTPTYESLTVNEVKGSGTTFIMDTDLAGELNSDQVVIEDADAAGTHYIQIKDYSKISGVIVTDEHKQLLVTDDSGKLTFSGKNLNTGGLFDTTPTIEAGLGADSNKWYLTKLRKMLNADTAVLLDAADNSYALWRSTNDSLRSRLGELRSGSAHADGVWARTQAGGFSGNSYGGRYNLYQIGYDRTISGKSTYGFAVDHGSGSADYVRGGGKDKLTAFSLYGIWQAAGGAYTNLTARYGMFDTDLNSYGEFPDKASYKEHAYSISIEYGKNFELGTKGSFIEPQAQLTLGRLNSVNYTTERGARGSIEAMNSVIARLGIVAGQKLDKGSIYFKANVLHEFAGKRNLLLASEAGGTNDVFHKYNNYSDTWFELGLGGNIMLNKNSLLYGEFERGFGGNINKKWSINAGVRFSW